MRIKNSVILLIVLLTAVCVGCSSKADRELREILRTADSRPDSAAIMLGHVDGASLSESAKHIYNLIAVKIADKQYVTPKSDSLIADVVDYYTAHPDKEILAEALYYDGRVASNNGDIPTAVNRFQRAFDIDVSPESPLYAELMGETGRLLIDMQLYHDALPYIENVARLHEERGDSIGLVYDLQALGELYVRLDSLDRAEALYMRSRAVATNAVPKFTPALDLYLSAVRAKRGDVKGAIATLEKILPSIPEELWGEAYALAARLYRESKRPVLAYRYALMSERLPDPRHREEAYRVLISPELREFVTGDELRTYLLKYSDELTREVKADNSQSVMLQTARFNYQRHYNDKLTAELKVRRMVGVVAVITALLIAVVMLFVYRNYRHGKEIINLQNALNKAKFINSQGEQAPSDGAKESSNAPQGADCDTLRSLLRIELEKMESQGAKYAPSDRILASSVFKFLKERIAFEKQLLEDDEAWVRLEATIAEEYPTFVSKLNILCGGAVKMQELHIAMLVKCGFVPNEIGILIGRTKGTVSSRRIMLGQKMFGVQMSTREVDRAIQMLK